MIIDAREYFVIAKILYIFSLELIVEQLSFTFHTHTKRGDFVTMINISTKLALMDHNSFSQGFDSADWPISKLRSRFEIMCL